MHSVNIRSLIILASVDRLMNAFYEGFFESCAVIVSGYMINDRLVAQSSSYSTTADCTDTVFQIQNESRSCSYWTGTKFTYPLFTWRTWRTGKL